MAEKSAMASSNLFPSLSTISLSARQQGRTVPIGLASKLIQGNTQNWSCGIFIIFSKLHSSQLALELVFQLPSIRSLLLMDDDCPPIIYYVFLQNFPKTFQVP